MLKVYKYPLEVVVRQTVLIPRDARILTCQVQGENVVLWALVNVNETRIIGRTIIIKGTGHEINGVRTLNYISTVQLLGGSLIFHIFEEV